MDKACATAHFLENDGPKYASALFFGAFVEGRFHPTSSIRDHHVNVEMLDGARRECGIAIADQDAGTGIVVLLAEIIHQGEQAKLFPDIHLKDTDGVLSIPAFMHGDDDEVVLRVLLWEGVLPRLPVEVLSNYHVLGTDFAKRALALQRLLDHIAVLLVGARASDTCELRGVFNAKNYKSRFSQTRPPGKGYVPQDLYHSTVFQAIFRISGIYRSFCNLWVPQI
jgi:hypothetical protein